MFDLMKDWSEMERMVFFIVIGILLLKFSLPIIKGLIRSVQYFFQGLGKLAERRVPQERRTKFKSDFPGWAQFVILFPNLTRWGLALTPLGISTVPAQVFSPLFLIGGILFSTAYILAALRIVPSEDQNGQPNIALWVILDQRLPIIFGEGLVLIIPGISKLIFFPRNQINKDIAFKGVRCRLESVGGNGDFIERITNALGKADTTTPNSGGVVDFQISITVAPKTNDGWAIWDMDNAGGIIAAFEILVDMIGEDVRQVGRLLTWLEATYATDILSVRFIADATGRKTLSRPGRRTIDISSRMTEAEVREYLDEARRNGFSDVKGLGFLIQRINVTSVTPQGKLAEAAETAVVEEMRRFGMLRNATAIADGVAALKQRLEIDSSLTTKEVIDILLVNDPDARVKREIKDIRIADANKLAEAIVKAFGGNN